MAEVIECQENSLGDFGILSSSLKFKKGESLSFCDRAICAVLGVNFAEWRRYFAHKAYFSRKGACF